MKETSAATIKRVSAMIFANLYQLYLTKVERKGRTQEEANEVLKWLTGYTQKGLEGQIKKKTNLGTFITKAPKLNPARSLITGVICGVRIEEIRNPFMREIRYMDKLIDELAKGRAMEKILRK